MASVVEVDPDQINASVACRLNEMSMQEWEALYEEIHGVLKPIEETPAFVQEKLDCLQAKLNKIPDGSKQAYNFALTTSNGDYVRNPKFRLMFLHVD